MASKQKVISAKDIFEQVSAGLKSAVVRPNVHGYRPHETQEKFHKSLSRGRLYIGGNRSGKTVGGATEAVWWATGTHPYRPTPEPPVRLRIVAVDFKYGVQKIVLPEISRWIPPSALKSGSWEESYSKEFRTLTLENGSEIEFMSYDQELDKFAGTSRHGIWFDEEPPKDIFQECSMRLIDVGGHWWMTMTPVEGMTWIYDDVYLKAQTDDNIFVVEVNTYMNPHLSPVEIEAAFSHLSDNDKKARIEGQFIQREGMVYKDEFRKDIHIIDPLVPPKNWLWVCAMDHGFTNPTAWLWSAIDKDGRIIIFDEHYESGKIVEYHAEVVNKKNAEYKRIPEYNVGDPSIRNVDPITGTSIQLEYIQNGIAIVLGNNDVKAGLDRVKRLLKVREDNRSQLYITKNCVNLLWEIPRYTWGRWAAKGAERDKNKKEEPRKKDDHAVDAMRYLVSSRPEVDSGIHIPEFNFEGLASKGVDEHNPLVATVGSRSRQEQTDYTLGNEY